MSGLFLSEVAEHVTTTLRKMPRHSEPGPLGMRAEHWYDFGSLAGNSDLFVQVVAHIAAAAAVPNSGLQYLKAGKITPLPKPTGGHRPLLMMSFLRRLALKSVMAAKKESVDKCAGPLQHGVGRPDGASTMIKTIQSLDLLFFGGCGPRTSVSSGGTLHTVRLRRPTLCLLGRLVLLDRTAVPTADNRCYHSSHQISQPCPTVHQDTDMASLLPGPHST